MPELITYPLGTPSGSTRLVGTQMDVPQSDGADLNITRNFTISSIGGAINQAKLGYTSYVALLTQTGALPANVPVATVLQNTTGETVVWTRTAGNAAGEFTATITGAFFTLNKTIVFINNGSSSSTANIEWRNPTTSTISIDTTGNSVLTGASIEIRVYA